jgi:hypothetical protein
MAAEKHKAALLKWRRLRGKAFAAGNAALRWGSGLNVNGSPLQAASQMCLPTRGETVLRLDGAGELVADRTERGCDGGRQAGHRHDSTQADETGDERVLDEILAGLIIHEVTKDHCELRHNFLLPICF